MRPKAAIVTSFPRSGTHLTIDFLRRNFVPFQIYLPLWESSTHLYCSPDDQPIPPLPAQFRDRDFIAQTHLVDFTPNGWSGMAPAFEGHEVFEIYPFRSFSQTVKSFAEFSIHPGTIASFLERKDDFFFGSGLSVADTIRQHAERALARNPAVLNIETLLQFPDQAVEALANCLSMSHSDLARRVPRRKIQSGPLGELANRLFYRRESTEVVIKRTIPWSHTEETAEIDAKFADLHAMLSDLQINTPG